MSDVSAAQWLATGVLSAAGISCALAYLFRDYRRAARTSPQANVLLAGPRPWRRLGAGIVALLSVMFFLGVNFITPRWSPRAFALFWLLMLLLVLWLCVLAWVDIRHTRRLTSERLSKDYAETMSRRSEQDKAPEERL